jgi:hypothetical protein
MKTEYDVYCYETGKTAHFKTLTDVKCHLDANPAQRMEIRPVLPKSPLPNTVCLKEHIDKISNGTIYISSDGGREDGEYFLVNTNGDGLCDPERYGTFETALRKGKVCGNRVGILYLPRESSY